MHPSIKPYKCSICDKAYTDKSFFLKHIKTHVDNSL